MRVRIDSVEQVGTVTARYVDERVREFDPVKFLASNRLTKGFFRNSAEFRHNLQVRLERTVTHLLEASELESALRFLSDFDVLAARIALEPSPRGIIEDFNHLEIRLSSGTVEQARSIRRALQLSGSVLAFARDQFPEQLLARLVPSPTEGRIGRLCQRAQHYKMEPWFRPLRASLEGPEGPLQEILGFQDDLITAACFDPHSGRLWTAGDNELVGWDITGREVPVRFRLRDVSPTAIACNGVFAALTTRGGPTSIFALTTGRRLESLPGHDGATLDAAFLLDGRLVTVGTDGSARIWSVPECQEEACLETGDLTLHCVLPLNDGRIVVGCDPDGADRLSLRIWDLRTLTLLSCFGNHSWPVDLLAINEDKTLLAAGANDELTVWRLADCSCLRRIATPHKTYHALAFVGPGLLASGDSSGELRLWRVDTGEQVRTLPSHSGIVSSLCVAPSGRQFATTSWDLSVRIWNIDGLMDPQPLCHDQQVTSLAFNRNESRVVSGAQDGALIIWDARDGHALADLRGHGHWISSVWAGDVIVSASWDGSLRIWDADARRCLRIIATGDEHVGRMACTADGAKAATVSLKGIVRVWNLRDGTQLATTASPETEIRSIAFLDDGNTLRWGTERHQVYDWFMNDADPIETVLAGAVPTTAWDLDEKFGTSVLGFANGGILIFDRRGTPKAEFGVEGCGPAAIVRSRDGDLLLTAGGLPQMASDNTARLWRTTAPENPTAIFIGDAPFTAAALSRDGRQAVLGDATGAVHFLEIVGL